MEAAPTVKRRGMRGVMMRGLVHKERTRSVWNSQCKRVAPRGLDSRALSTNTTSVPGIWVRCGLARHGQWSIISKVVDSSSTPTARVGVLDGNTGEGPRELLRG